MKSNAASTPPSSHAAHCQDNVPAYISTPLLCVPPRLVVGSVGWKAILKKSVIASVVLRLVSVKLLFVRLLATHIPHSPPMLRRLPSGENAMPLWGDAAL